MNYRVVPGVLGEQDGVRDSRAVFRDVEPEDLRGLGLGLLQGAIMDRIDDLSRDLEIHSLCITAISDHSKILMSYLSDSVLSAGPAGVNEPGVAVVLLHLLGHHLSVDCGVKRQEGCSEAG